MSLNTSKDNVNNWKNKAVLRNKIISQQKKTILELSRSRDEWKLRFKTLKNKVISAGGGIVNFSDKKQCAKWHQYSLILNLFCVQFLSYGAQSFRGCVHSLVCINLCFKLGFSKIPCPNTIRNWACKMGYYRVHEVVEKSDELWVILIDESISIGCEKILLVLGIPLSKLNFSKALDLSELRVLAMEISKTWQAEEIAIVLQKVSKNYPIGYIISDSGSNLKKSYLLGDYLHIPDCTHSMANILASLYEKEPTFIAFCQQCSALRQRWALSKQTKFMPPKVGNKLRFANVFALILWAKKNLDSWDILPDEVKNEFVFLTENKSFLLEFYAIQSSSLALQKILKIQGYSQETHQEIKVILEKSRQKTYVKQAIFKEKTMAYLAILEAKKPKEIEKIQCSSDSIESAFGKLKQKISPNSSRKMTVFVLTLASIGSAYSVEEVKKGLETVKEKDLKNYRKPPKTGGKTG